MSTDDNRSAKVTRVEEIRAHYKRSFGMRGSTVGIYPEEDIEWLLYEIDRLRDFETSYRQTMESREVLAETIKVQEETIRMLRDAIEAFQDGINPEDMTPRQIEAMRNVPLKDHDGK